MADPVNPQAFQFRDQFYSMVPPWLRTGNGERYMYTLEVGRDLLCEKAFQAMTIRLPGVGDYSNLGLLAFDRNLLQGPAESNEAFAGRLAGAFEAWGESGAARAVIEQLQAYLQNLQPGVGAELPAITVVITSSTHTTWNQVYQGTPIGAPPTLSTVSPANFDWDGDATKTWRAWLILPMALVPVPGLSGNAAATSTAAASKCWKNPGQNLNGVWVPATSGTPVNYPWLTLTGLSGLTAPSPGAPAQWITLTGSSNPGNVGCFQIVQVLSSSSCVVANPNGVASDAGPLTWTIGAYPFLAPGPAWGAPGYVFGQGELSVPLLSASATVDSNSNGVALSSFTGSGTLYLDGASDAPTTGTITIPALNATVSYTGVLGGAFTGCTTVSGSGTLATGQAATYPRIDTGSNIGGVWQPSPAVGAGTNPTIAWGLMSASGLAPAFDLIASIRTIVKTWKSGGTYYRNLIVAFDCGTGAPGNAYSPNSSPGSGNPDGTFGSHGELVDGVWVPTRAISGNALTPYLWDCYCQGTGTFNNCSVENIT